MNSDAIPLVVACLGSSTTAGRGEAFNWIGELERRAHNARFRFHNHGVGGDLAYSTLQRLPAVVATHPDLVVILVGGNDILTRVFPNVHRFLVRWKRLPQEPSAGWYRQNLIAIVRRLKEETEAEIALVSLEDIGEDPGSTHPVQRRLNELVRGYNALIKEVAAAEGVTYIPFYERLHDLIGASPGQAFTNFRFLAFYRDAFRYYVLRNTGDRIAMKNGWRFHVDGVHLNERGGRVLADLVDEFVNGSTRGLAEG